MKSDDLKVMSFKEVAKNGIFALLFVGLLLFVIYDSRGREAQYQDTIKTLSEKIAIDVKEIKQVLVEVKENTKEMVIRR